MRALLQRIQKSSVQIEGKIYSETGPGLLVFLGVSPSDAEKDADILAAKIPLLRIFEDAEGRMNLSVSDIQGEIMVVSQFTLYADTRKGNRPSFTSSAHPEMAKPLYEYFMLKLAEKFQGKIASGVFAADMKVSLVNDGPVTILLDSHS